MAEDPHQHPGTAPVADSLAAYAIGTSIILLGLIIAGLYLLAGRSAALRGRSPWSWRRTASWLTGVGLGVGAMYGSAAAAAGGTFTAHMSAHLVLAMLVPLLLVLGAPVTMLLRAVPVSMGRRITAALRAAPVRVLTHPVAALLINTVPLFAVYWDGRSAVILHHALLGPLVHVHFVAAGFLFTSSVVGIDPNPHRAPVWIRVAVLVASIAAHGVLAKQLYATPQQGVPGADAELAAQVMYYGGDVVHLLLLVVFCAQVYRASGRRLRMIEGSPIPAP